MDASVREEIEHYAYIGRPDPEHVCRLLAELDRATAERDEYRPMM